MAVSLDHFMRNEKKYLCLKLPRLAAIFSVLISNVWDHKPNTLDHPKSEHVRISSPDCISFNIALHDKGVLCVLKDGVGKGQNRVEQGLYQRTTPCIGPITRTLIGYQGFMSPVSLVF